MLFGLFRVNLGVFICRFYNEISLFTLSYLADKVGNHIIYLSKFSKCEGLFLPRSYLGTPAQTGKERGDQVLYTYLDLVGLT
jgi:hypothetical protein